MRTPIRYDLTGHRFSRWTVLHLATERPEWMRRSAAGAAWICRCECGTERAVLGAELRRGASRSCGCLQREVAAAMKRVHGASADKRPGYYSWQNMRARCNNPKHPHFSYYGARGITVCERWKDFAAFIEDMGAPESGMTLERIDVDLGYSPENCRWASRSEQMRNTRRNVFLTHDGRTQVVADWAAELGVSFSRLRYYVRTAGPNQAIPATLKAVAKIKRQQAQATPPRQQISS